jgi:hypothetical protein
MIRLKNKTSNYKFLASPYKNMNKRGGHVGMMLSFVIFITFLVFLYSITEPATRIERGKQDLLSYLKTELVKEFSSDMTSATINASASEKCIKISPITGTEGLGVIAQDLESKDQGILLSYILPDNKVRIDTNNAKLVKVYYSDEFEKVLGEDDDCGGENSYSLGLVRTEEHIFESKIQAVVNDFEANYSEIRDQLNIAPGDEFGFSFRNANDDTINTPEKNVTVNIYVEEVPIQYIDSEANIKPGFLSIRVW